MTGGGRRWPHLANRHHITVWAQRVDAPPEFPRLVRRLIDQTNDQVVEVQMRTDEGTRLPGYDGFSRALRGTPFVPEGPAVWELGTSDNPKGKADEDYKKRTDDPLGVKREETTFVFVTPRSWSGKSDWEHVKRSEGIWANVVAHDADDIEQALDRAPAAHVWFSELAGVPAQGAQSLTSWWERFSQLSSPPLTPALVLAGRLDAASELLRVLEAPARVITISANDEEELLVFVAAVVLSEGDDDRVRTLHSRSIIVKDAYTIDRLEHSPDSLVLVPYYDELRREARLVRAHHVVIRADAGGATVDLPPIDIADFRSLLVADGMPSERALELARLASRSIYAFQRAAPTSEAIEPAWASQMGNVVPRRAWLAGRWNKRRTGDVQGVSDLVGVPYDAAQDDLVRLAQGADPLFVRVGDTWAVTSISDAWGFGHSYLREEDLTAYESLIQSVFGSVDPRLDLPVADRWMAGVYGKVPIHSGDIRNGIAEVLALIGARAQDISVGSGTVQTWLHQVAWRLFDRLNSDLTGQLWASLADVMPLLAEAAPDVFLQSLSTGLEGDRPILAMMFADGEDTNGLSIASPHTGLLWSLEGLAWSPEHFGYVVEELARLAELDPGGRLSNRPAASLSSIFRPWLPQTTVNSGRRLAALDVMRERHPDVAWNVTLSMLPQPHAVGSYSHKPKFREWPTESEVTPAEVGAMFIAAAERALDDAGRDAGRWIALIQRFEDLPDPGFDRAVDALRRATAEPSHLRDSVWEPLRGLVMRHRRYAHTDWALDPEKVEVLEELLGTIAPDDPAELVCWLFDEQLPDLPEESGKEFDAARFLDAVDQRRTEAVRDLYETAGTAAVVRLAVTAKSPWLVGYAVGKADLDDAGIELFRHIDSEDDLTPAARAWSAQRAQTLGWGWVEMQVAALRDRPLARARVLLELRDFEKAWSAAREDAATDSAYWAEFMPYGWGPAFELAERASAELLAHDRTRAALMMMNLYVETVEIDRSLVLDALERFVKMPPDHPDRFRVDSHEIEHLLDYLRAGEVDDDRVMLLEWRLRPALSFEAKSPRLELRLARDPKFFLEILSLCFKPRGGEPEQDGSPQVATNAYRLLDGWAVLPGSEGPDQPVNEELLNAWADEVVPLLVAADREGIGLEFIGRILAKAGGDVDGTWPTRPVRDLIERLGRSELDTGFLVQVFNSRGVTTRGVTEGGEQERALVTKYKELASLVADKWPRTAAIIAGIADGYAEDARRQDEEVRRFLEGLER